GVEINRATGAFDPTPTAPTSGDEVTATALDWTKAIHLGADAATGAGFTPDTVTVQTNPGSQTIAYTKDRFRASGSVTIDVFGFVTGTVGFAFETHTVDVDLTSDGQADLTGAALTLLT